MGKKGKIEAIEPVKKQEIKKPLKNKKVKGKSTAEIRVRYIDAEEDIAVVDIIEIVGTGVDAVENILAGDRYFKLDDLPVALTETEKADLETEKPEVNKKHREKEKGDGSEITNI